VTKYRVDTTGSLSQVVAELDNSGAVTSLYVRASDELLAVLRPASPTTWATRFVHVDGLGSVRVLTDEAGLVTDTRDYEAFGVRNESAGSDSLAYGFAGEPFEVKSQLAYHRARWMDPSGGRFVGMDPGPGDWHRPITLHRFVYVGQCPISRIDPSGYDYDLPSLSAVGTSIGVLANSPVAKPALTAAQAEASVIASEGAAVISEQAALLTEELATVEGGILQLGKSAPSNLGRIGESIAEGVLGMIKNTNQTISSYTGKASFRIPDFLSEEGQLIGEVKNVSRLSYTSQLKDFMHFASDRGFRFVLFVRDESTRLSKPLQAAILDLKNQSIEVDVLYLYPK
jgi:RHS repeat-associated protein